MKTKYKILLFILFVIFWLFIYSQVDYLRFSAYSFKNIKFTIRKWENLQTFIDNICSKNIINDCINLRIYAFFNSIDNIKPWDYYFSWSNIQQIFEQIKKWPPIKYEKFTILPGRTKFDIAKQLKKEVSDKFLELIEDKNFINQMKQKYSFLNKFWDIHSLEWFLYPDQMHF